jgi:hypothetical protein
MSRRVYLWHSPDGVMAFGTAQRAMAYIEYLFGPVTWVQDDDVWRGDIDEEGEAEYSVCAMEVH